MADNIRLQASSHTFPCTSFKILLHEPNENMVKNKIVSSDTPESSRFQLSQKQYIFN